MKKNSITIIVYVGIIIILISIIVIILKGYKDVSTNIDNTNIINNMNSIPNGESVNDLIDDGVTEGNPNVKPIDKNDWIIESITSVNEILQNTSSNQISEFDINKVTITIKEESITSTSMDIIVSNQNERVVSMASKFVEIQKYVNGEWVYIGATPPIGEEDDAIELKKMQNIEAHVEWEKYYGKLGKGKYKASFIIKNQIVSAEFDIKQ